MFQQLAGQTVDSYRIVEVLGEGGMGAVLKGFDVTLQRDVAIKVMHIHIAKQPNFQERFLQEARTLARLDHPCIVQIYSFGQFRSMPYIVMKFIPGDNLEKMLNDLKSEGKWLVLKEALLIMRHLSNAMDYAHQHGVLHRDIKPSNIMIDPVPTEGLPYRPVITDLGLAKLTEGGVITQDGTSMGTPAYMSPEQAFGQATDLRSDVFSLGVLLFELSTGQLPFKIHNLAEAIDCHSRQPTPSPRSIRPDLPTPLETIILKAMEKDPANRYQTAGALAKALETISITERTEVGPTAMENAVSLITQYQKSLVNQRGPSVLKEFKTPSNLTRDLVQIMTPDKRTSVVNIKPDGLTIGRDADNDIALDDQQASRHHARIQVDGEKITIYDLNSTNGTYLANNRLLPGVGEVWTEDKAIRIGNTWLRLRRGSSSDDTAKARKTRLYENQAQSSAPGSSVGISVSNAQISVEPGQSTSLPVTLQNQGILVDHFQVTLTGIPATWLAEPVKSVQMMPGDEKEVTLVIKPPRNSQSRAGRHPIKLVATSRESPNQVSEVPMTLTVAPFSTFTSELYPQKVRAGKPSRLTIKNQGNVQENYAIDWSDRADELVFSPRTLQLRVPEGQTGSVEFLARPRQTRLIGREQSHAFVTRIAAAQGEQQTQTGEVITRALIPPWVPPLVITLCLILAAVAIGLYTYNENRIAQATQTVVSASTAVANIVASTGMAQTAISEKMANANAATKAAATQNAIVQGTADTASTQAAAVIQTATAAAQQAQNDATSTALAAAAVTQTAAANATATAEAATATAVSAAATASAAQTQTAVALAGDLNKFTKTWVNMDRMGSMERLDIEKVNDTTVSISGFFWCYPSECSYGTANVPFTPPTLQGKWTKPTQTTSISVTLSGEKLLVTADTKFSGDIKPPDTIDNYVFETLDNRNKAMSNFIGNWKNIDPGAGMPQLVITKENNFTLLFHGYGLCSPSNCDWGEIQVAFTPPTLQGIWKFDFKETTITVSRSRNQLKVTTFDKYNPGDSRPDRTTEYTFQK